jgi:predicted Zn-dependent protease
MSGGHFDYKQYELQYIADAIEELIRSNDDESLDQFGGKRGHGYSRETISEFYRAVEFLRLAFVFAHRIDWLVSGDDGEETFHERLAKDLEKL